LHWVMLYAISSAAAEIEAAHILFLLGKSIK
jgi:hypothetical protein